MMKRITAVLMSVCVAAGLFYTGGFTSKAAEEIVYEEDGDHNNYAFDRVKGSTSKETIKSYEGIVENLLIASIDGNNKRVVVDISAGAFKNNKDTKNIKLPEGITSVDCGILNGNYTINNIDVDEANKYYSSKDGILYNKTGKELIKCPNTRTYVKVPENVETIGSYSFSDNSNGDTSVNTGGSPITDADVKGTALSSISIPKSVKKISEGAFYDCYDLTEIYYEGTEAEWKKVSIETKNNDPVAINPALTVHYEEYEPKPTEAPTPEAQETGNTDDPSSTLTPGTNTKNTAEPSTGPAVTVEPSTAPAITIEPSTAPAIKYSPTPGNNHSGYIYTAAPVYTAVPTPVPTSAVTIPASQYNKCIGSKIIYTAKVNSKGKLVATVKKARSKNIKSVVIPDTITIKGYEYKVTGIAKNAFANCKKLGKAVIGKNVSSIGANAFKGCKKLKSVAVLSSKVTTIGKDAYKSVKSNINMLLPKKKYKAYKKLMKKAALPKKAKYKKIVVL